MTSWSQVDDAEDARIKISDPLSDFRPSDFPKSNSDVMSNVKIFVAQVLFGVQAESGDS
jgi:hypothetical protein